MQYESSGSYTAISSKWEPAEGSLIKMDVMRNEGTNSKNWNDPNLSISSGANFIQSIQYNRRRIDRLMKATAIVGLIAIITFITTLALNLPQKSQWKKDLEPQAQEISKSLKESDAKIPELERQIEELLITKAHFSELTQTLTEAKDEIKRLQNKSKILEAQAKECCSNVTSELAQARIDIKQLQNRSEGKVPYEAKYIGMAAILNKTANDVEKLQKKSEGWNATYLSMERKMQHNLQYIGHLENQTKALLVWADKHGDASDRLEEMMQIMSRYNTSDVFESQSQKLIQLSASISDTNQTLLRLMNESDYCPLKYNGKCFWIARRLNPRITFQQGREICALLGGKPANIYSNLHHNMVMEYLRLLSIDSNDIWAWTGMTYSFRTRAAYLYDGRRAPFVKWYPGNPKTSSCCNIALRPREDWTHTKQDMYTTSPTSTKKAIICEK